MTNLYLWINFCFKSWNSCNMLVYSWITNSVEESIA